ncbi:two-component sensor histidine kinase [Agromyces rhizosphaerae]|uniref:Sensor-like histidine kinase SenX3 n=1 Tax=Agromyces rhizosphaerae TaxID=88374 RepID=A0A9W6D214_9MICO|nr:ATP-binding protein [Agromyces rhizosphaerae]GLI28118.1 two-component sensor histidine kinase [Agromyces rhizosphaerae]
MESTWLVLAALGVGSVIGAAFVVVFLIAERRGSSAAKVVNPTIPEGIDEMLDALETAGVVLDPSNNVLKASPGALAMGLVWDRALVHTELVSLVDQVRRTGEATTREVRLVRGPIGDTTLLLRVRAARLGPRYVMLLAEDRTEANRLDDVRRDFVANISHELKTPIASVTLLAEALDHAADDPDRVRRFAQRLTEESARLGRITNEIIELSRLQAHEAIEGAERIEIDALVRQAVDQNRVIAASKRVDIAIKAKSKAAVYGDEALLRVAVHNLIANALTYSHEGSRVGIGVYRSADGVVEIAVTDQGIGIAEADLDRVFERFYRVDQARARDTGGSGLGLAIVKHTVQNHGGDVRVWSQPGRGSTFTIRLPEAAAEPTPEPEPSPAADSRPRTPEETRK